MAYHMSYDEIKYEQESQRGGYDDDPYAIGPGPDLYRPDSAYASTGGGGGSTRGKCLHCEQPVRKMRRELALPTLRSRKPHKAPPTRLDFPPP